MPIAMFGLPLVWTVYKQYKLCNCWDAPVNHVGSQYPCVVTFFSEDESVLMWRTTMTVLAAVLKRSGVLHLADI